MESKTEAVQSELNIGTLGHVDHGKTTLTAAITGVWTDKHSESIKRSMTIKLGYADAVVRKCDGCTGPGAYTTKEICPECGREAKPVRRISILDAPGHETLMATAIAGSNIIDAVIFVISASEPCPMPQTYEHLMLINALGITNIIVVQTKIDIVGKIAAEQHYKQIKAFLKGSAAENAPIIPVMANKDINVDAVLEEIANIKIPKRDLEANPVMYIARSFDVNKPGTPLAALSGGVLGGSIIKGKLMVGDSIEIRPGMHVSNEKGKAGTYIPLVTKIESLSTSTGKLHEAAAGGLIAIGTDLNPELTKADNLVGNIVGMVGKLPTPVSTIALIYHELKRKNLQKQAFKENELLILGIGTATVVGFVTKARRDTIEITLRHPICIEKNEKVSILRNFSQRWYLTGYAIVT